MNETKHRVCPVGDAWSLDNKIRRLYQNPVKILEPYLQEGMTVLDVGCGPGFFTIDMAGMVGEAGKVIAVDLQEGMLQKLRSKIKATELESRIELHQCDQNKIGISEQVDFILLFYMVHEVPEKASFFTELFSLLKSNRQALIVEPPFHVSGAAFRKTLQTAEAVGFKTVEGPKMLFHNTAILIKG
ncbi:MAG: class I SAM-dependent methyltransferase [Desulfatiglans sp.]|jgi:ubiquinone/menaquinone biosynthesis C-methylase UbiE|nr:class I SAM-dependent methyltransferase [Desulfatiglans sp.]